MQKTACLANATDFGEVSAACRSRRIGALLACILAILLLLFVIGPALKDLPLVRPLATFVEERDIDAGALYYTDIEEFAEAEINMNHTMKYMPADDATSR